MDRVRHKSTTQLQERALCTEREHKPRAQDTITGNGELEIPRVQLSAGEPDKATSLPYRPPRFAQSYLSGEPVYGWAFIYLGTYAWGPQLLTAVVFFCCVALSAFARGCRLFSAFFSFPITSLLLMGFDS